MLECMDLCKKYNLSITFEPSDDPEVIIIRAFAPSTKRGLQFSIYRQELDNVVDKEAYVSNLIYRILDSLGLKK